MEDTQTDIEILLECLKCQMKIPDSLKTSLVTLASILTANDGAKECFRELGGLKYIFDLIVRTEHIAVKQSGLFCLACGVEKHVFAQNSLSTQQVFDFIHEILSNTSASTKMKQTAVFFLLCLVANNSLGQNLARQTGCLVDLMEMCKVLIKEKQSSHAIDKIWTIVNSAISVCVNNPQNEENQHLFSTLFPHFFKLIEENLNPHLLKPSLSLIGLAVANNVVNQDRVRRCNGLDILVNTLGKCMGYSVLDEPALAIPVIATVDSCITDHEANCIKFGKLGGIKLLLETLQQSDLDQQEYLQVVLTLGHTLDTATENQKYIDRKGYQNLVRHLTEAQDEELIKALKYTLNLCQKEGQTNFDVQKPEKQKSDLILEKISTLSAQLNSIEEASKQESKLMLDAVDKHERTGIKQNIEEIKTNEKKVEEPQVSRTESLLTQLVGLFKSFQKKDKITNSNNDNQKSDEAPAICTEAENIISNTAKEAKGITIVESTGDVANSLPRNVNQNVPQDSVLQTGNSFLRNIYNNNNNNNNTNSNSERICQCNACIENQLPRCSLADSVEQNKSTVSELHNCSCVKKNNWLVCEQDSNHNYKSRGLNNYECIHSKKHSDITATTSFRTGCCVNNTSGLQTAGIYPEWARESSYLSHSCPIYQLGNNKQHKYNGVHNTEHIRSCKQGSYNECDRSFCKGCSSARQDITTQSNHGCVCKAVDPRPVCCRFDTNNSCKISLQEISHQIVAATDKGNHINNQILFECSENCEDLDRRFSDHSRITSENKTDHQLGTNISENIYLSPDKINSSQTIHSENKQKYDDCQSSNHKINDILPKRALYVAYKAKPFANKINAYEDKSEIINLKTQTENDDIISNIFLNNESLADSSKKMKCLNKEGSDANSRLSSTETKQRTEVVTVKDGQEAEHNFVKPNVIPLKRKIVTSSSASAINGMNKRNNVRVFARRPMIAFQVKPVTNNSNLLYNHIQQPPQPVPSPAASEFDFHLLTLAKQNLWNSGVKENNQVSKLTTPVAVSVNQIKNFTDQRSVKKCKYSPSYCHPISEMCQKYPHDNSGRNLIQFCEKSQMGKKNYLCPGCNSSEKIHGVFLNSRTYNITLETSCNTCSSHRYIRSLEREFIQKTKALTNKQKSRKLLSKIKERIYPKESTIQKTALNVYDFHTSNSDSELSKPCVSPPHTFQSSVHPLKILKNHDIKRRRRIPYSDEELKYLKHGVENMGKRWNQILVTYKFNPSRTAVDLKEKYQRLVANKKKNIARQSRPFSMCEERRLLRGVKIFGYNWKGILRAYKFFKERTAEDLRNKWRHLNKNTVRKGLHRPLFHN